MALSSIVVVLALCLAAIALLIAQVLVVDAAREAARLAARGDEAAAQQAVEELAPDGSELTLTGTHTITARVEAPPWGRILPGIRIGATAVAAREPDAIVP